MCSLLEMAEKVAACFEIKNPNFAHELNKHLPEIYKRGWISTLYGRIPLAIKRDYSNEEEEEEEEETDEEEYSDDYEPTISESMRLRNDKKHGKILAEQPKEWLRKNELFYMRRIKERGSKWFLDSYFERMLYENGNDELEYHGYEQFRCMGLTHEAANRFSKWLANDHSIWKYHLTPVQWAAGWLEHHIEESPIRDFIDQTRFHEDEPTAEKV